MPKTDLTHGAFRLPEGYLRSRRLGQSLECWLDHRDGAILLLPRLPDLSLWKTFDFQLFSMGALHLSLFQALHLAAGFCLVSYAAVRKSLIYQRHLVFRERRGRKPSKLRTDGFFARVRHPMSGTALLYNLGLFFAFCSGWGFIPFLLIGAGEIIATLREEKNDLLERL